MTLAVPVEVISSQKEQLGQLHYLTTFGHQLVILAGPQGAGKSTLLELFLEQASDYASLAYLQVSPQLKDEHVRSRLFQQIKAVDQVLPTASLSKVIRRAAAHQTQHLILVIDNAHHLSHDIFMELLELVAQSRQNAPTQKISVVLGGLLDWAARQRQVVGQKIAQWMRVELVKELSLEEGFHYAQRLLASHPRGAGLLADSAVLYQVLQQQPLYPGMILATLEARVLPDKAVASHRDNQPLPSSPLPVGTAKKQIAQAAHSAFPNHGDYTDFSALEQKKRPWLKRYGLILGLTGISLFVALAMTWWLQGDALLATWKSSSTQHDDIQTLEQTQERQPLNTLDESPLEEWMRNEQLSGIGQTEQDVSEQGSDDVFAMTYLEAAQKLAEAAKQVRQEGELQFSLLRDQRDHQEIELAVEQVSTEHMGEDVILEEPSVEEPSIQEQEPENHWLTSFDNHYFIIEEPDVVVLQLGAVRTREALQNFIEQLSEASDLKVYHTLRQGADWYVVTVGRYGSLEEARTQLATMPESIQVLQPWAKPVEWIHNELQVVIDLE